MRGDGSVFKRGRYWYYVFWLDGQAHQGSTHVPIDPAAEGADEERARRVLAAKREAVRRGDEVPQEERLTLGDLRTLLEDDYVFNKRRSTSTMRSTFKHLTGYFGERARAVHLGTRVAKYVKARRDEGAAEGSIRIELALLNHAYRLAVKTKRLAARNRPDIELPPEDEDSIREGFFRRGEIEQLCSPCNCPPEAVDARSWADKKRADRPDVQPCWHLPPPIADVVQFLFFCPWRIGAARGLEWRDYSEADQALTLRSALNKTKRKLQIPVDAENTPELMAVIERQRARRRLDCPYIFHGARCTPHFDKQGNRRPCLGDYRAVWNRACTKTGMAGRIPHDLRRSGVKHYIDAGVDPHTVMQWSGHRTPSMLRRYHIIDLNDLRRAGKRASDYRGPATNVVAFGARPAVKPTTTEPLHPAGNAH